MKLAPWWLAPLNPVVRAKARPYMTTFEGLESAVEPAARVSGAFRVGAGDVRHRLHRLGRGGEQRAPSHVGRAVRAE
ncbi:MAG: hypothetical protein MZW92_76255 [Comamonadaceae bacterium]|nr:hypothetical protein [Comamonadaceae bacterium]